MRESNWDPETRVLTVTFHQGRVYEYAGVSETEWRAYLNAPSIGKHLREVLSAKHPPRETGRA